MGGADAERMIISDEQVRLALRDLQYTTKHDGVEPATGEVSTDLLKRICDNLAELPETRGERVAQARADMAGGGPPADAVASKMLGRIISDSLR